MVQGSFGTRTNRICEDRIMVFRKIIKNREYLPEGHIWIMFDLSNGHPGSHQYAWWFRTKREALAHKKHINKLKFHADISEPQLWIKKESIQ